MATRNQIKGLLYRKVDLHVHTPASKCFDNKSVGPEDIVGKALEMGLDAIAITDHNTGACIDKVKKAAKGELAVFPGVEVSATGGQKGTIHIVGIFDESKSTKDIENLLGDLGIKADKYGDQEAFTKYSPDQVIDKISNHGGMAILAHANQEKGVMGGMKGNPRINTVSNPRLMAAEATDFENHEKREKKTRVADYLDGSHAEYRKLPVYQASDNPSVRLSGKHSVDGIGLRYTYFKVDEISFEGLRQCFCDPDVRIRQKEEYEITKSPKIIGMEISDGFLKNQKVGFHGGLNAIVGGKGVGKSLVVEFLRFGINQPSMDKSILRDHQDKLEKRLGPMGKVTLQLELEGGEQYQIVRTHDGDQNRIECTNLGTGEFYDGEIPALFPILAYSQHEVIRIAEDPEAQLRLVDSFIDSESYKRAILDLSTKLRRADRELAKSIDASSEAAALEKELNTLKEKLKNTDRALKNKLFDEIKIWERKKSTFEKCQLFHDELIQQINDTVSLFESEMSTPTVSKEDLEDANIQEAARLSEDSLKCLLESLENAKNKVIRNKKKISQGLAKWMKDFEKKRKQYEKMLEKTGGDKRTLEGERRKLEKKRQQLEKALSKHSKLVERLGETRSSRDSLLGQFEKAHKEFYQTRRLKFNNLTQQSKGKLRLTLRHASNREKFKEELLGLKKGSRVREGDIEKVSQSLMPREFVDLVIDREVQSLATNADLAEENAKKLIEVLNSKEAFEDVLALSHAAFPEDVPSIEFKKEDGNCYPLSELSVGQKCTALLIIALSEGTRPIIIDQPEDSLDNPSIYEDIVSKLRMGKERRQFVLTTHNSSVGVASDSDQFIVLRSSASQGNVECFGAIDRQQVRSEIVKHLEGGPEPYKLKSKKYNVER